MPTYAYLLQQPDSSQIAGVLEAADGEEARVALQRHGLVLTLEEAEPKGGWLRRPPRKDVSLKELRFFTCELASLLGGGILLARALHVLAKERQATAFGAVLQQVHGDICRGRTLHEALARHRHAFPALYVAMVQVGEETGRLVFVLKELAAHLERQYKLRARIRGILAYPMMVCAVAARVLVFFSFKIVPTFEQSFRSLNLELPFLTRAVVAFSSLLSRYSVPAAAAAAIASPALKILGPTRPWRLLVERARGAVPVVRDLYRSILMERFCSLLALTVGSGIVLPKALDLLAAIFADDPACARTIQAANTRVIRGAPLSEALPRGGHFSDLVLDTIRASEEAGSLVEDMSTLSGYYKDSVEAGLDELMTVLEPVLIVLIGGVIGVLILSLFLPIFEMGNLRI
ncbi:MAG TPA: type II secretion system F family protein [Elusimicrobiota bacterium]|nr:type II secretion system F family protein [Elusimicrobiota bacterium]